MADLQTFEATEALSTSRQKILDNFDALNTDIVEYVLRKTVDSKAWNANNLRITNVSEPVEDNDVATKAYVVSESNKASTLAQGATVQAAINELDEDIRQVASDLGDLPSDMQGATLEAVGIHGYVPAPAAGDVSRMLAADGTWKIPPEATKAINDGNGNPITSTYLTSEIVASSMTTNGYVKYKSGLIIQWGITGNYELAGGRYDMGGCASGTVTFPIAFPNASLHVYLSGYNVDMTNGNGQSNFLGNVKKRSATNFYWAGRLYQDGGACNTVAMEWFAIGY